jgi:hypothetical protein
MKRVTNIHKLFKIKVNITWIVIVIIIGVFAIESIIDNISYSKLCNEYKSEFLDVTKNLAESDKLSLFYSSVGMKEIENLIESFGFSKQSNIDKVEKLNSILLEIQEKHAIGRSRRNGFYSKIYKAQMDLEALVDLSNKYLIVKKGLDPNDDMEKLHNIYLNLTITRDSI